MRRLLVLCVLAGVGLLVVGSAAFARHSSGPITGVVRGYFHRDCFACGDSARYIVAKNVWCGWRDGKVIIHVAFYNHSVEGLKVTWHPSYTIRNGSDHGTGISSLQDTKIAGGGSKNAIATQSPKDTPVGARIGVCKPSFYLVGH